MPRSIDCGGQNLVLSRSRVKYGSRVDYCIDLSYVFITFITGKHILVKHISCDKANSEQVRELRACLIKCDGVARDYDPFCVCVSPMS